MYKVFIFCGILAILQGCRSEDQDIERVKVPEGYNLKLVFIAIRGGEYTPSEVVLADKVFTDSEITKETFAGYPLDDLLEDGKTHMFQVGNKLRERYEDYLGKKDSYSDDLVDTLALNLTSVIKTVLYVKKGLENQVEYISDDPKNFTAAQMRRAYTKLYVDDFARFRNSKKCPKYFEALEFTKKESTYDRQLMNSLTTVSEKFKKFGYNKWSKLYEIAAMAKKVKKAPSWFDESTERALKKFSEVLLHKRYSTTELLRLSAGRIMSEVENDILRLKNDTFKPEGRKMYLFGTTAPFFMALVKGFSGGKAYTKMGKYYKIEYPNYGATHIAEAYEKDSKYYFKFYYDQKGDGVTAEDEIKIKKCKEQDGMCDFESFQKLLRPILVSTEQNKKECLEGVKLIKTKKNKKTKSKADPK